MAYGTKYRFIFDTLAGTSFRIDIQKDGYSGSVILRALGQSPHLRRDSAQNGICGTSLEIYAECSTDGEFAELYTTDARQYKVLLQMYLGGLWSTVWTGFVSPELYSEPEIAPPYDVCITAIDGLGELKMYDFPANGRQSLRTHLQTILAYTGLDTYASDIISVSSLRGTSPTIAAATLLANTYVNLDHLSDGNCYDALQAIMQTLHLTITRYNNKWLLIRESDVVVSGGTIAARNASGTSVSLPVAQYESMDRNDWWPVGQMETEIVPAKKQVIVGYPYHVARSLFTNPETANPYCGVQPPPINVDDCPGWDSIGEVKSYAAGSAFYGNHALIGKIQQTIAVEAQGSSSAPDQMQLVLQLAGIGVNRGPKKEKIRVKVFITNGSSTGPWLKKKKNGDGETDVEWTTNESYFELTVPVEYHTGPPELSYTEYPIIIPYLPAGNLTIQLDGSAAEINIRFSVGGVYLTKPTINGYRDVINIDNSARNSEKDIQLSFGDGPYTANALASIPNILSDGNNNLTSNWATAQFTGEYLSVIAMDYALGVALPRLLARGTIKVPKDSVIPAAFLNPDGIPMLFNTWDWDLFFDEVAVNMTSIQAAEVTIDTEAITQLTDEQAAAYASGTAGGSGGGRGYPAPTTGQNFFDAVEENSETVGAHALFDLYIDQDPEDETAGKKNISEILRHLRLETLNEGTSDERLVIVADITLMSEGNLVAGGIGGDTPGGGGGSIASLADVTLTNLAGGDILRYDATTLHWINQQPALSMLSDVDLSGTLTDGLALCYNATTGKWEPRAGGAGPVAVTSDNATIGTSLTRIATVAGVEIKAQIASYLLAASYTGNGTSAVNRAVADVNGRNFLTSYAESLSIASGNLQLKAPNGSVLSSITGANVVTYLIGNNAVARATADANGKTIASQEWVNTRNFLTSHQSVTLASGTNNGTLKLTTAAGTVDNIAVKGLGSLAFASSVAWSNISGKPTTIAGYGITDAKIANGVITLGGNTITPLTSITVSSAGATIGTTLTTIATVAGTDIKAKIAAYLLASDFNASNIVATIATTPVKRATADGNGNVIADSYLRKNTDDTMAGNLTVGTASANKTLTLRGSTSAALNIYGGNNLTSIYRDATYLQISSALRVSGNIVATGNVTAGAASDRRLKDDIRSITLTEAADLLSVLNPVVYRWNDKAAALGGLTGIARGFLADEYLDLIPNAGRKIWDEYDAIDYNQVIPYLVAGWQQQNLRLRIAESEIRTLKEDNQLLRRRLREYGLQ